MVRRVVCAAAVLAAVVAVAGCSSASTSAGPASTAASTSSSRFEAPLTQFVLQERDMPSGFTVMSLSGQQRASAVDDVAGPVPGSTVTPVRCQPDSSLVPTPNIDRHAVSAFVDTAAGVFVTSTASRDAPTSATYARYHVDGCGTRTVTSSSGTQTVTEMRVPIVIRGVRDPVVVEQTSSVPLTGFAAATTRSLTAVFDVNGTTVTVSQRPLTASEALNRVAFQALVRVAAAQAMGT